MPFEHWLTTPKEWYRLRPIAQARRRYPAPQTAALWERLRRRQIHHLEFRRQEAIGGFLVDFFSYGALLAIVVDTPDLSGHLQPGAHRTRALEERGVLELRFSADEIDRDIDAVVNRIADTALERRRKLRITRTHQQPSLAPSASDNAVARHPFETRYETGHATLARIQNESLAATATGGTATSATATSATATSATASGGTASGGNAVVGGIPSSTGASGTSASGTSASASGTSASASGTSASGTSASGTSASGTSASGTSASGTGASSGDSRADDSGNSGSVVGEPCENYRRWPCSRRQWRRLCATVKTQRQEGTVAEKLLWGHLRNRRLDGLAFRRQKALDDFVADFYCSEARLVIELDGPVHDSASARDGARTARLEALGLTVIRFTNDQITTDIESVLDAILYRARHRR